MNFESSLPFLKSFSMGMKLIVVCTLALLMTIPALFVNSLVSDRTSRAAEVTREVSRAVGGEQTFLGPTLAIPYSVTTQAPNETAKRGLYLIFPAHASAVVQTATEERHRSLFKVPIFQADVRMDANFDLTRVGAGAPPGAVLDWSHAELVVRGERRARSHQRRAVDGERRDHALGALRHCPGT